MTEFTKRKEKAVAPIFHEAGAALYLCQHFEFTVKNYLFCLSRLGVPDLDIQDVMDILNNNKKMTVGQLITKLKKHVQLSGDVPRIFAEALDARNRIIHGFLIERA